MLLVCSPSYPHYIICSLSSTGAYSSWFANLPNPSHPPSSTATPALTPTATPIALPSFSDSFQQSFQPQQLQPAQHQTQAQALLLSALSYVVNALPNQALCLQAGVALRNLCDSNRKALAPHIAAFGELHSGLGSVPVSTVSSPIQGPSRAKCVE